MPSVIMLSIVAPLLMFLMFMAVGFLLSISWLPQTLGGAGAISTYALYMHFQKIPQSHYDEFHFTECHNTLANISYIYGFWFFIKHQLMAIRLGGVGAISIFAAYMCILSVLYLWLYVADRTKGRGYCSHPTPPSPPMGRSCKALPCGVQYRTGENLKVVCVDFSTLS
jgi:hypothetical protein